MKSDADLVTEVLRGQREGFAELVRRHERSVHAAARAVVRDGHAAEDIAQEAFLAAWKRLGSLRDGAAFGSWVLKIARRLALRAPRPATSALRENEAAADPAPHAELDEGATTLLEAVLELPPREREVLMLKYFEDLRVAEIAAVIGQSVGTITKRLTRARQRLRSKLGRLRHDERTRV